MKYKVFICYPDKSEIEIKEKELDSNKVLDFFLNYPWIEQMNIFRLMSEELIQYNPSVRFKKLNSKYSLELSCANEKNGKLSFNIWFGKPSKIKILLGLFGSIEKKR